MACKVVTCCDLEDFPETSSSNGNCPVGYYWQPVQEVCKRIPPNAILNDKDGMPLLNEDGEPLLNEF